MARVTVADVADEAGVSRVTASKVLRGGEGVSPSTTQRVLDAAAALGYGREQSASGEGKRVTIADIASAVGLSKGSVSFALNGQAGISPENREKILETARQLGWRPHSAARALSSSQSKAIGLVLARDVDTLGSEPYFMRLIAGIEAVLSKESIVMLFQTVPSIEAEMAVYDDWWSERRIDGLLLNDLRVDDPRLPYLQGLGIPSVFAGLREGSGTVSAVFHEEAPGVEETVLHLRDLGHRSIGRVAGPAEFAHIAERGQAFARLCSELGIEHYESIETDYSMEQGAEATRYLLARPERPTALVYDNDIMALAGLREAQATGLSIPQDLSIVAWDDSLFCQASSPSLTAVARDIRAFGEQAATSLLDLIRSGAPDTVREPPGRIVARDSTAPPPS
ncbi:substrate-binding domain-containing protein [Salinibacterium soli]|uniref:Substrate-binding domain-containing protein n=1 Tax=Antiquaquibacter soli TaxID=3064523 RepID=A0ABT9BTG7_9MICO|nr:substrate-binding domain-containing protein [Protaetiibacter sp. WY-16]MDO7882700.1 substrate-binding domain-containing protein [Protaetiibacter sp. WY-16]